MNMVCDLVKPTLGNVEFFGKDFQKNRKELVDKLDPDHIATEVIPSGGGARNTLWLEIKADLLQRNYLPQASGELATKGAAAICTLNEHKNTQI